MAKIFIFSAPSGAGKTTIVHRMLPLFPKCSFSISATTRSPRGEEMHGKDYYFLSEEEFKAKIEADEFLEWEEVYKGRFYGTLKSEVDRLFGEGSSVLFDVDVKGAINIKSYYGDIACAMFIAPPSIETLRERLLSRGTDNPQEVEKRINKSQEELTYAPQFDHVILNDDLEKAVAETQRIMENHLV